MRVASRCLLTVWHCNTTGTYSGSTLIDPDTILPGQQFDRTTNEGTFLQRIMNTNFEGTAEFLTIFPSCYTTRSTHIHLMVQTNVSNTDSSYEATSVLLQHTGQLFFSKSLINSVCELDPYSAHLSTLSRTLNNKDFDPCFLESGWL